jgi:hypothetical protein
MKYWYLNGRKHSRSFHIFCLKLKVRLFLARVIYGIARERGIKRVPAFFLGAFQYFKNNYTATITFKD